MHLPDHSRQKDTRGRIFKIYRSETEKVSKAKVHELYETSKSIKGMIIASWMMHDGC
jgi:hypothetical protein